MLNPPQLNPIPFLALILTEIPQEKGICLFRNMVLSHYLQGLLIGRRKIYYKLICCIFRPTHIRYTPLQTYASSAILHFRPARTWFYSCKLDMWPQWLAPQLVLAAALGPLAFPRYTIQHKKFPALGPYRVSNAKGL